MPEYESSTQNSRWLFSPELLGECRNLANRKAREALAADNGDPSLEADGGGDSGGGAGDEKGNTSARSSHPDRPLIPQRWHASGYSARRLSGEADPPPDDGHDCVPCLSSPSRGSHPLLTPDEELALIQFYSGKLADLVGPSANVPRLRRDAKVAATASLLFRRFYLSNSIMIFDPKAAMVASAFLACKVEDCTADVRYMEEGTKLMSAPVTVAEILRVEANVLVGVNFELLCFHPYKVRRTLMCRRGGRASATGANPTGEQGDWERLHGATRMR